MCSLPVLEKILFAWVCKGLFAEQSEYTWPLFNLKAAIITTIRMVLDEKVMQNTKTTAHFYSENSIRQCK